jgi:Tfp pilus assembly protein PilP
MARKRKTTSPLKKVIIISAVLAMAEIGYIVVMTSGQESLTMREAIDKAVSSRKDVPSERKEQLRVQLAVTDFMASNGGAPPATLDLLIPKYFDQMPISSASGKAFLYKVVGTRFYLAATEAELNDAMTPRQKSKDSAATQPIPVNLDPKNLTPEQQQLLLASLNDAPSTYVYDPLGKRDPFRPFDMSPKLPPGASALERYDIGQLKLTAVLNIGGEPTANVENAAGKGFLVKKGTKIGLKGGEVVEIFQDKLLILETDTDFTGQSKTKTIELKLRTKDLNEQ